jgi:hypothetical protein
MICQAFPAKKDKAFPAKKRLYPAKKDSTLLKILSCPTKKHPGPDVFLLAI